MLVIRRGLLTWCGVVMIRTRRELWALAGCGFDVVALGGWRVVGGAERGRARAGVAGFKPLKEPEKSRRKTLEKDGENAVRLA